jgi:hypothetical protein
VGGGNFSLRASLAILLLSLSIAVGPPEPSASATASSGLNPSLKVLNSSDKNQSNCISNTQGPDESCIFDSSQKKCAPDDQGNCPPGFGHNSKDQCFPTHKCPPGFARENNDEGGACKKTPIK